MSAAAAVPHLVSRPARAQRAPRDRNNYLFPSKKFHPETCAPTENCAAVPHLFWALIGKNLVTGGAQLTVLGYLMARTWGDKRSLTWACVPISDIVRETKFATTTVEEALADLVARGLVVARKNGGITYARGEKPDGWEKKKGGAIDYRVDVAFWAKAAKCADEELNDPEPADEEDEDKAEEDAAAPGERVALQPRQIRSVNLKVSPDAPLLRMTCQNRARTPIAFSARTSFGSIRLTLLDAAAEDPKIPAPVGRISCNQQKTQDRVSRFNGTSGAKGDLDAVASLLRSQFGKPRDEALAALVLAKIPTAPVAEFQEFATAQIDRMRRKRKPVEPGILVALGAQFETDWWARQKEAAVSNDASRVSAMPTLTRFSREELQRMAAGSDAIEREFAEVALRDQEARPLV